MKDYYLKKADENLLPLRVVEIRPNIKSSVLDNGDSIVIDLGCHYVGYFSFKMWFVDRYIDAPVRMTVRFCELEKELADDYSEYNGWICRSWLQEDIINVDFPGVYKMPRRYAARYVKITVLNTPKKLSLSDFVFEAVSAADINALKSCEISDSEFKEIDRVAVNTLKNCMQRVFEDGPKRDRRLWIGDLRLEALANYYTFGNIELVKRCLYLFAAADKNEYGFLPGFVYENPIYFSGDWFLEDYSLLFVCTLCDYFEHTADRETFDDMYAVAKGILDACYSNLDENGIVRAPTSDEDIFIDWCEGLSKKSAFHGVYLYTLDLWCKCLFAASMTDELSVYISRLAEGRASAMIHLIDQERCAVINELDDHQYSVHSTAWMILAGVLEGEKAVKAITDVLASEESLKPFTPYMHHYTVEAMIKCGLKEEARAYILKIWGGMLHEGADTFFEAYDPTDPEFSPYGDRKVNSMCHAWSCTPTYFIRKYGIGK